MTVRFGRVAAVHPEDNSVDVVMVDDGARMAGLQVMAIGASTNTGLVDLPVPETASSGDKWDMTERTARDLIAVVLPTRSIPIVIGFMYPQICQMLFADFNRRVNRHASDVYSTIDANGNTELYHPSGTYFRVGTSPAHEDLTGKDVDKRWKIDKNTDKAVHVHLTVANAGNVVATIDIDPSGNLNATFNGQATINVDGTTTVNSGGAALVTAPSVTLDTPTTHCTGQLIVDKLLTFKGGMTGSGGAGGTTATITGTVQVSSGDVTADGKSLKGHTHPGDSGGTTGAPN